MSSTFSHFSLSQTPKPRSNLSQKVSSSIRSKQQFQTYRGAPENSTSQYTGHMNGLPPANCPPGYALATKQGYFEEDLGGYLQAYNSHAPTPQYPQGYAPVGSPGYFDLPQSYDPLVDETTTYQPSHPYPTRATNPNLVEGFDHFEDEEIPTQRPQKRKRRTKNRTEDKKANHATSKRAIRRAEISKAHGSVGSEDKPKGLTRMNGYVLEWFDPEDKRWRPAAPHDHFRGQFIAEDNARDRYDQVPEHGRHNNDITTFCSALGQKHWDFKSERAWDNIKDEDGNKVLYLLERPERSIEPEEPERLWMHNGLVLLDPDDHPVRNWGLEVPRCFSSKMEGGRIEALRRIFGMTISDFRARMPRTITTFKGSQESLYGMSSLNQRISRFRDKNNCPAWLQRSGGPALKEFTLAELSNEAREAKTTEGLRSLSKLEIEKRKLVNRGKFLEKAGGRALSDEERQRRDAEHARELERLEKKEAARQSFNQAQLPSSSYPRSSVNVGADSCTPLFDLPGAGNGAGKRKRDDTGASNFEDEHFQPAQKRPCFEPSVSVGADSCIPVSDLPGAGKRKRDDTDVSNFEDEQLQPSQKRPCFEPSVNVGAGSCTPVFDLPGANKQKRDDTDASNFEDEQLQSSQKRPCFQPPFISPEFEATLTPAQIAEIFPDSASEYQGPSSPYVADSSHEHSESDSLPFDLDSFFENAARGDPTLDTFPWESVQDFITKPSSTPLGDIEPDENKTSKKSSDKGAAHTQVQSQQDLRYEIPRTIKEQVSIKTALSYTHADYRFWNRREPPLTPNNESYFDQYIRIQNYHHANWSGSNSAPDLINIGPCYDSFDHFKAPDRPDEILERLLPEYDPSTPAGSPYLRENIKDSPASTPNVRIKESPASSQPVSSSLVRIKTFQHVLHAGVANDGLGSDDGAVGDAQGLGLGSPSGEDLW